MEFSGFEEKILGAVEDCKGSVKHCARNAINHLEKAWVIRDIDIEMAVFRGITAEEEAASAVFHCLKNHRYSNAHKLEFKQHPYKLGLYPFLESIRISFAKFVESNNLPIERFFLGHIEKSGRRALELILNMPALGVDARPQPPLHFSVTNADTGRPITFEADFMRLIEGQNYTNALKYITDRAIQRNKLLYAHNAGIPKVEGGKPRVF